MRQGIASRVSRITVRVEMDDREGTVDRMQCSQCGKDNS